MEPKWCQKSNAKIVDFLMNLGCPPDLSFPWSAAEAAPSIMYSALEFDLLYLMQLRSPLLFPPYSTSAHKRARPDLQAYATAADLLITEASTLGNRAMAFGRSDDWAMGRLDSKGW